MKHKGGKIIRGEPTKVQYIMASPFLKNSFKDAGCLVFFQKIKEQGFSDKLTSTMPSQGGGDHCAQHIKISFTNAQI